MQSPIAQTNSLVWLLAICCLLVSGVGCTPKPPDQQAQSNSKPTEQASPAKVDSAPTQTNAAAAGEANSPAAAKTSPPSAAEIELQKESKLKQKLQEPTSFDFEETPLGDALQFLAEQHEIDILLDEISLEDDRLTRNQPVTLKLADVSLEAGLRNLLRPLRLSYVIEEGALLVCTAFDAENVMRVRVYPVRDLILWKDANGADVEDSRALLDLITAIVAPDSWDYVGGPGSLKEANGLLTVTQTNDVLTELDQLLAAIRKFPLLENATDERTPQRVRLGNNDPRSSKCRDALDLVVPLEFIETPLGEVVEFLRQATGVPILVDEIALKDEGLNLQLPITLQSKTLSLRAAMRIALPRHSLYFMLRDETLVLTSIPVYEEELVSVLYSVRDLLPRSENAPPDEVGDGLDPLIELIQSIIEPHSWDAVGGGGSIDWIEQRGVLVISNNFGVHEQIEFTLGQLRKLQQQDAAIQPVRTNWDQVEVVIYELWYPEPKVNEKTGLPESPAPEHINTERLVSLVPELLGPDVWKSSPQASIHALQDRLVVKQTKRVQRKVQQLLHQLGVGVSRRDANVGPPMQGMGSGNSGSMTRPGAGVF